MDKSFDIIVFGATGFTGRLVAEYLNKTYGVGGAVRWAMAGRSAAKLAEVRDALGISADLPLLVADANDATALADLVAKTHVVLTTVGPYQRFGEPLIRACAAAGTDYVDLCGEPAWMAKMIPELQPIAQASGARIVFSCGFDSIPFDLGVLFAQQEAQTRFGAPLVRVHGRVKTLKGTFSGGTVASMLATMEAIGHDPSIKRALIDPFSLTPGFKGPRQPNDHVAEYDALAKSWTAPFVMAPINTKNVHRSHFLLGHPWGADFVYSERTLTGDGDAGEKRAKKMLRQSKFQNAMLAFGPTRALLKKFALPKLGEGPNAEQREKGRHESLFFGETADGRALTASVFGDRDPGYGSTCKMISEAALCLAHDIDRTRTPGGVWTPAAAMGMTLVERLQAKAGLTFKILDR
ncbi:MAG: saccharopine dehydrogenase NADP-binding domain-containing protein [Xanthomonadaceae bacterium]|nr:saccharopine dehydrogenase NADP-binding domain-containing protein [Xanthomonadaceae bacterium]